MTPVSSVSTASESELYELSLVFPRSAASPASPSVQSKQTNPMIVFSTSVRILEDLGRMSSEFSDRSYNYAARYCPAGASFWPLSPDLFGNIEFGYDMCGFVTKKGDRAFVHIELRGGERVYGSALTLRLLARVFERLDAGESERYLRRTQVTLSMMCEHIDRHGHTVGGYISPCFMAWLRAHGKSTSAQEHKKVSTAVVQAMKRVWKVVCVDEELAECADYCRLYFDESGRFLLGCPGNACDLGIYPDQFYEDMVDHPVRFSSHNLDLACQQLTLIAGLVKLCEIARQSAPQKK